MPYPSTEWLTVHQLTSHPIIQAPPYTQTFILYPSITTPVKDYSKYEIVAEVHPATLAKISLYYKTRSQVNIGQHPLSVSPVKLNILTSLYVCHHGSICWPSDLFFNISRIRKPDLATSGLHCPGSVVWIPNAWFRMAGNFTIYYRKYCFL